MRQLLSSQILNTLNLMRTFKKFDHKNLIYLIFKMVLLLGCIYRLSIYSVYAGILKMDWPAKYLKFFFKEFCPRENIFLGQI